MVFTGNSLLTVTIQITSILNNYRDGVPKSIQTRVEMMPTKVKGYMPTSFCPQYMTLAKYCT